MRYVRQLLIILLFSFIGEILHYLVPLPIPASIYGLVLLFAALELHVIKLSAVRETGRFLVEIMPIMFIPAGVGLIDAWADLRPMLIASIIIVLVSTVAVMVVSGRVTQLVIRRGKGKRNE